jgi:GntR family transcriptional repressor for pyruvate dehydrogenase complex
MATSGKKKKLMVEKSAKAETGLSFVITTVRGQRVHEAVAEQIRQAIFNGQLETGSRLPSEREMAERFQASRVCVREALQTLQKEGLIVSKRGYGGGAFVADFSRALRALTDSFTNVVQLDQTKSADLTEIRTMIEPNMTRLATERATAEDLAAIEAIVLLQEEELAQGILSRKYDMDFHRAIADATHNSILSRIVAAVNDSIRAAIYHSELTHEMRSHVVNFHRDIYEAIKSRKAEKAYRLMNDHVLDVLRHLDK